MDYAESHKRLLAAQDMLVGSLTTREKFSAIRQILKGVHPKLDAALEKCDQDLATLDKIYAGQVIDLAVENLPENTDEQKSRKKALLLLVQSWNKLRSEVARVEAELTAAHLEGKPVDTVSVWHKIFSHTKGPLGIITAIAVGVVLVMQQTGVTLRIENEGCEDFVASGSMPVQLPGLRLPNGPIPSGSYADAVIPPLPIEVDGTQAGMLTLKALSVTVTFQLPSNILFVTLNGTSLLGERQEIRLSDFKHHTLVLKCR
jgi:hypothetical protein